MPGCVGSPPLNPRHTALLSGHTPYSIHVLWPSCNPPAPPPFPSCRVWQGHPSSLVGPFARNAGKAYTSDYLPAHRDGDKFYMYNVVLTNYAML